MEPKVTSPTVKGLILTLILIVFSLVTIYTDQMENKALGYIPLVLVIAGIIWACINYSNQMDNNVTFGNVFGHGFKMVATITALMAVYTLLLFLVIKPDLVEYSLEKGREAMAEKGSSDAEIENGLRVAKKLVLPFAVGFVIIAYGIGGTIIALIGAAVAKKNPRPTNPF
jgi:uncharacterized protein DUF4199